MPMTAEMKRHPEVIKDYLRDRIHNQLSALYPYGHLIRQAEWLGVEELRETLAPLIERDTIEITALEEVSRELARILRHLGEWSQFQDSIPARIAEIIQSAMPEPEVVR